MLQSSTCGCPHDLEQGALCQQDVEHHSQCKKILGTWGCTLSGSSGSVKSTTLLLRLLSKTSEIFTRPGLCGLAAFVAAINFWCQVSSESRLRLSEIPSRLKRCSEVLYMAGAKAPAVPQFQAISALPSGRHAASDAINSIPQPWSLPVRSLNC